MKGLPCLKRTDRSTGKQVTILIDSGSTNNYINKNFKLGISILLPKPIKTRTLHGISVIRSKRIINVLDNTLTFFDISDLTDFDMILGEQGLRQIKAKINLFEYKLYYKKQVTSDKPNYTNDCTKNECMSLTSNKINYTNDCAKYEREIKHLMKINEQISEILPFTTTILATIRTKDDEPVYTKQYPYPYSEKEFVDSEINKLLNDGIIEKSYSPYNSPIWVVPKKGTDLHGKPKRRLVIDYQKLNAHTITDKYPIPDIGMTIQNLGRARFFSTIDLESGFHQILIKKEDREKTAFSINHAKYQFKRMPFGLKNAPSIFQRCVNDILQKFIGIFAYVYIDDVLIFSLTLDDHMKHISLVFHALHEANMKISGEKSHFFKTEIEFLGHIIKHNKITVDPEKINTIKNYELPRTLKQLRSFMGLSGYYRKFIRDYAKITKPLTLHLRSENGLVKKNQSSKVAVNLDKAAVDAFERIKVLLQEKVELYQPDFNKAFELTTDASNYAIGAVLSQGKNPITFISRTLNPTEQNYATNEKEILAIVWSLQKLRNYLYGIADLTIYTDHQSLIYSISDKNPNTKLKRWKNFIAEFGADIKYKPGSQNAVADALSRHQNINFLSTDDTIHSNNSSPIEEIERVELPLNQFKNQIEIIKSDHNSYVPTTIYQYYQHHKIKFTTRADLMNNLNLAVSNRHINAIFASEETFFYTKKSISDSFPNAKFVFTTNKIKNITERNEQLKIIQDIHNRAHRHAINNYNEAKISYFWPNMKNDFVKFVRNCDICKSQKYERNPIKQPIGKTPIPTKVGESISMDIFYIDNRQYVTSVDRYSKYLMVHSIDSKVRFHEKLEEILTQNYPNCNTLITDNEAVLVSNAAKAVYQKYGITHITTPVQHSISNGTVERAHSTLIEIIRCLNAQNKSNSSDEIYNAVREYNRTIHSVTNERPVDVNLNPNGYPKIASRILEHQKRNLNFHNKNRQNRGFKINEVIFVKSNRRRKDADAYTKHVVKQDLGNSVLTTTNKVFHKDSIRRNIN